MKLGAKKTTGWKATISVAMSNYIEAGSIIAIATSLGFWQDEFGISNFAVGLLAALSANAFGAAIGAAIGGPLCDRYGRKAIYTYDLIVYMVGVLLAAFAMNFGMLMIAFVVTGIAVGAGVPASWTYIAEQAPSGARAKHVGTAQLAWSVGPLVGFALAAALAPLGLLGSRIIFLHLFVVAAVVWWIRQGLVESKIWKDEGRENADAPQASASGGEGLRGLFSKKVNITALLVLIGIYGFWNTVAGQAGIFMPRVYETAGLESEVQQNLLQVLVWGMTVLATYFVFMRLADHMSQRLLFVLGAIPGIFAWGVLVLFTDGGMTTLLIFAICWGISSGVGAQAFYSLWASELFATPYRASAQGIMFFVVRTATGLLSYFFPTLLAATGLAWVGLILMICLTASLIVGVVWAPNTRGKELKDIEIERYGEPISPELTTTTPAARRDPVRQEPSPTVNVPASAGNAGGN
ncbi:MFS transporter [Williamsia sp. 1138]|uniref:MFS transporter n=1 Tax=Williamsia sp. 1138 TaxID=1903117 RepID=UPI001FEDD8B4|nr:MFS transporter [Williamsia sp. 1138]